MLRFEKKDRFNGGEVKIIDTDISLKVFLKYKKTKIYVTISKTSLTNKKN